MGEPVLHLEGRHAAWVWRGDGTGDAAAQAGGAGGVLPTGLPALDGALALGGLPWGGVTEVRAAPGLGGLSLALHVCGAALRARADADSCVAVVDPGHMLHAPTLMLAGLPAGRAWCLRPPTPERACLLAARLLQSGVFAAVVVDLLPGAPAQPELQFRRLALAAQQAGAVVVVLTGPWAEAAALPLPTAVRLRLQRPEPGHVVVEVEKQRGRGDTARAHLAAPPFVVTPAAVPVVATPVAVPVAVPLVPAVAHPAPAPKPGGGVVVPLRRRAG